jgi:hypothetical protein
MGLVGLEQGAQQRLGHLGSDERVRGKGAQG